MVLAHNLTDGARTQDIETSVDVTFDSMLLSNNTLDGLKSSGFHKPSPIQLHGIPLGKCGFDLFLEAKSGTGKTAVFTVIALEKLDLDKPLQTVILTPTREIAAQICSVIKQIGSKYVGLNVEVVMGGLPVEEDIEKFQKKVHIVVGSPGRMRHLIHSSYIDVSAVRLLVIDEADKLMDRSFKADINYIFSVLPKQKQVIMSSATYPDTLKTIMQNYVQKAQHICPDSTSILLGIKQLVTTVKLNINIVRQTQNRFEELLKILSNREFKQCLIFCNYQVRVGELCNMLMREKWPADRLHGQLEQTQRLDALKTLQEYKCRILVSTDLAARGIDASNVDLVINFEPPFEWQTYLHRIGRGGRFGSYGIAITILSEGKELTDFKQMIKSIGHSLTINYLWDNHEFKCNSPDIIDDSNENPVKDILESQKAENNGMVTKIEDISNRPYTVQINKTSGKNMKPEMDKINKLESGEMKKASEVEFCSETLQVEKLDIAAPNQDDRLSAILETEKDKVLDLVKELGTDHRNELSNQIIENNEGEQNFPRIFNVSQTSEQFKMESFNDLMAAFKVYEPNNDDVTAVEDVTFNTFLDSVPNSESQPNILLELHSDTDCEIVVSKSNQCASNSKTNSPVPKNHERQEVLKNVEATVNDHSLIKTNNNCTDLAIDRVDYVATSLASRNALKNAGLPTSFGSKKHSNRVNGPEVMKTMKYSTNDRSNQLNSYYGLYKNSETTNKHTESSSRAFKETFLNSSEASHTSIGDDGYNTHSCLYSRSTKCMQPRNKPNRFSRHDIDSVCSEVSNVNEDLDYDVTTKYNTWYTQLKTQMKLIEMSLYIDELSKM